MLAIVSCSNVNNYGSVFQALATQWIFDDYNVENETINYIPSNNSDEIIKKFLRLLKQKNGLSERIKYSITKARIRLFDYEAYSGIMVRNNHFRKFTRDNIRFSKPITSLEELERISANYEGVVVGSDQVWNPGAIRNEYFTLMHILDNVYKFSYSSSFGVEELPNDVVEKAKTFLKRFSKIAVREKKAVEIVKKVSGRDATLVLDPVLLFSEDKWASIATEYIIKEKYVFCYFLGTGERQRKLAMRIRKEFGYKIVMCPHLDYYYPKDYDIADYLLYDVDPSQFLYIIKNAEYVITDSFHGTALSVIFKKRFYTFARQQLGKMSPTNNRFDSFFSLLDLESRFIKDDDCVIADVDEDIDYSKVDARLMKMKNASMNYLASAITEMKGSKI